RKAWRGKLPHGFKIAVNVSSKQFARADFVDTVEALLEEHGGDGSGIALEITEGTLVENAESVAETLGRLRAMGLQIHIDDFGTGYSSLSYLHRFPINTLKIDHSFVSRMGIDENLEIVRTIMNLARNLGLDVIAEGVETKEQVAQ